MTSAQMPHAEVVPIGDYQAKVFGDLLKSGYDPS